ncbi:MAG: NMCC_0638 family (lipo)protein [Pseudomonadales bacterium]
MFKRWLFCLALPLVSFSAAADSGAQFFIKLYSKTCAQYVNQPDALRAQLSKSGAPVLSEKKAAFFLDKKPGTVWVVPNVLGDFVIALDERQHCTVFARKLDKKHARSLFKDLVSEGPLPFSVAQLKDGKVSKLRNGVVKKLGYRWRNLETEETVYFTLLTAEQTTAEIQAQASVRPVQEE